MVFGHQDVSLYPQSLAKDHEKLLQELRSRSKVWWVGLDEQKWCKVQQLKKGVLQCFPFQGFASFWFLLFDSWVSGIFNMFIGSPLGGFSNEWSIRKLLELKPLCICKAPPAAAEKSVPPDHGLLGRYVLGPCFSLSGPKLGRWNIGWWKWNFYPFATNGHGFQNIQ